MRGAQMMNDLRLIATTLRRWVLQSTTAAGSGHPTSCLSAVEAVSALIFGGFFRAHLADPDYPNNDRFILSKGHAAPLLYAVYAAAGVIDAADLTTLRQRGSVLEGHPTARWPYTSVATGSLGQGLAAGIGFALDARWRQTSSRVFVLLGDGEAMEGSNFEAMTLAAHLGLTNLIAAVDINGLGQRGTTIWEHDMTRWRKWGEAAGWRVIAVSDGHNVDELTQAWSAAIESDGRPTMLLLSTTKGHGISFLDNASDRHGRALSEDELARALTELGDSLLQETAVVTEPPLYESRSEVEVKPVAWPQYEMGDLVATREAIGSSLAALAAADQKVVVLDAEVGNSTHFNLSAELASDRFVECFIAEQSMIGVATGLARAGRQVWAGSFAAFLTRATDQLRMAQYSDAALKVVGSHAGVSIGEDGPSQMGLEDIAIFRSIGATVLYPADANAAVGLTRLASETDGLVYLRATRGATRTLYGTDDVWEVGGSRILLSSEKDLVAIVAAGVTVYQALLAAERARGAGICVRVIDAYSVDPIDHDTMLKTAQEVQLVIVVEDHRAAGGLGEVVSSAVVSLPSAAPVVQLAVRNNPGSATPAEQLHESEIDADAISHVITTYLTKGKL